ncbi:V-type ATP synthase subunit I [Halorientalis marina]|uniref:V-type ATP synthase subunit I n=1 Tax=Halorientalis marina TaxID=2931976 RepID=UPI001FF5A59B|nr:V-type ATP synthase subunit I [Halorientalis marina]
MLRPERMSRVSVTGSKQVMDETIETLHELNLLHVTDYDDAWEGFEPGDPIEGADEASEKLVVVRSLESILGVEEEDAGPTRLVTDDALDEELEGIRQDVNELDERRDELTDELRSVEEKIDTFEPFAKLGIDMDLLTGYDSLSVAVGEGDAEEIRGELREAEDVEAFQVYAEDGAVAVYVYPADDADPAVGDLLVGASFQAYEVPDAEGSPEEYISELRHRKQQLEGKLDTVEDELEDIRLDVAGFLLAAEETLSIEVQKSEAPLTFATTDNAFVAEGWLPTTEFVELADALETAVGDHVEVEELERAEYDGEGHVAGREPVEGGGGGVGEPTAADGGETATDGGTEKRKAADGGPASVASGTSSETRSDGGAVTMGGGEPPVIQKNSGAVKPFEALVEVINRPKYSEFDPTLFVFLTFPAFFGFMIGDLGYGILYMLLGGWLASSFDSDVIRSLGGVGLWAGGFTALFGILYGEIFGLHLISTYLWEGALGMGGSPMHKGLQPVYGDYAILWLVLSLLAGVLHLTIGWILDFIENLSHGFMDALTESGSWLLMMFGLWAWIFSGANGSAPSVLVGPESVFAGNPLPLGFTGLPAIDLFTIPGLGPFSAWLVVFLAGLVLLATADLIEVVEFLNVLVNVLSYTRLAAVLLAKAGMAFVVNLLFFGVYVDSHGAWHFGLSGMPTIPQGQSTVMYHGHEVTDVMFGGLMHGGIAMLLVGILILVIGHALVLVLGITSAGLQSVRLEYVEFFGKFYEGGGRAFEPFGYERKYTTED